MSITPSVLVNAKTPRPDGLAADSAFSLDDSGIPLALASTVGVTSVEWSIVAKPTGATTTIASATPTTPFATTFGPLDQYGTYILKCVVNGDAASVKEVAVAVLTPNRGMRIPAQSETTQWDGSVWWGDDIRDALMELDSNSFETGLSSGDTKAYSNCISTSWSVTGNTPTVVDSFVPPSDCAVTVTATIDAQQSDKSDSWGCTLRRRFNVSGAVVTAVAAATLDYEGTAGSAGITADITTSGGIIRIEFTGIAAQTWRGGVERGYSLRTNAA